MLTHLELAQLKEGSNFAAKTPTEPKVTKGPGAPTKAISASSVDLELTRMNLRHALKHVRFRGADVKNVYKVDGSSHATVGLVARR